MLLTVADLSRRWQQPPTVIYGMRSRRQGPPALKIGKELRFRLCDVIAWEEAQVENKH